MARVVEGPAKKVEKEKSCETLFRDLTTKKVLNCWLGSGSALKRAIRNRPSSMMKKWDVAGFPTRLQCSTCSNNRELSLQVEPDDLRANDLPLAVKIINTTRFQRPVGASPTQCCHTARPIKNKPCQPADVPWQGTTPVNRAFLDCLVLPGPIMSSFVPAWPKLVNKKIADFDFFFKSLVFWLFTGIRQCRLAVTVRKISCS